MNIQDPILRRNGQSWIVSFLAGKYGHQIRRKLRSLGRLSLRGDRYYLVVHDEQVERVGEVFPNFHSFLAQARQQLELL